MATAVSFRHGTADQHNNWYDGIEAEITVAVNSNDETQNTVWFHDGIADHKGVPLARADLANIDSTILTSTGNFNVLKYDLTNFRGLDYSSYYSNNQNKKLGKDIADYLDLPTKEYISSQDFAKTDMSNVESSSLASGSDKKVIGKGLAYGDLSNLEAGGNTVIQNKINTSLQPYATTASVDTKLANYVTSSSFNEYKVSINTKFNLYQETQYKSTDIVSQNNDIYYPTNLAVSSFVNNKLNSYQNLNQKATSINSDNLDNNHYPTNLAVVDYMDNIGTGFANIYLDNVVDWGLSTYNGSCYKYNITVTIAGSGYNVNDVITTDIPYSDGDSSGYLKIIVKSVVGDTVTSAIADPEIALTNINQSYTDSAKGAKFTIGSNIYAVGGNLLSRTEASTSYAPISHSNNSTIHVTQANKNTWNGKQNAITDSSKLSSDLVDDTNKTNKFVTTTEKNTWNNKVDKTSDTYRIYGTNSTGGQITYKLSTSATESTIPYRDTNGTLQVGIPTANNHATTKKYVDDGLALKADSSTLSTVATTGEYSDLLNKPTIPAAQVNSDWNASSGVAQILNKPNVITWGSVSSTYSTTGTNPVNGTAVETQHFVRGGSDANSQSMPTHIAIYATDALALSASQQHTDWICFSLGQ